MSQLNEGSDELDQAASSGRGHKENAEPLVVNGRGKTLEGNLEFMFGWDMFKSEKRSDGSG